MPSRLKLVPPGPSPTVPPLAEGSYRPWEAGRVRTVDGVETYYIRQRLGPGVRFDKAVASGPAGQATRDAALSEWALFRSNPAGYRTPKERGAEVLATGATQAVRIDVKTVGEFLKWAREKVKAGELSDGYVKHTLGPYLIKWGKALQQADLRRVTLDDIQKALKKSNGVAEHKRVVALKAFTRWAREDKDAPKLHPSDDPTVGLKTPEVTAEKTRRKKGYEIAFVHAVYRDLPSQPARDMLRLRACAHGIHDSEIQRLAGGDPRSELVRVSDPSGIEGVLVFRHKRGDDHAVPVDAATFAAAERLHARGSGLSRAAFRTMLQRVAIRAHGCGGIRKDYPNHKTGGVIVQFVPCKRCVVLKPGDMRASFVTWAKKHGEKVVPRKQKGVDLDTISEAVHHANKKTTRTFYLGDHIPTMVRIKGLKLKHPEDP